MHQRQQRKQTMTESHIYNLGRHERGGGGGSGGGRPSSRKGSRSRSKMYERYDVDIPSSSRSRRRRRGFFSSSRRESDGDDDGDGSLERLQRRNRLLLTGAAILLGMAAWPKSQQQQPAQTSYATTNGNSEASSLTESITEYFAPKKRTARLPRTKRKAEPYYERPPIRKGRWNPCLNTRFELERHDHEPRHGDICRARGGLVGTFECPEGCHETAGNPPFCANSEGTKGKTTLGEKGGPCRVKNPNAAPEYRCDYGSVCILAVGTPKEQFKGVGQYVDDTCDNKCGDGRKGELTPWVVHGGVCSSDMDCSLSGVCNSEGKCDCDPWAEGVDCSYLKFDPVDRSRLGYLDEHHSSWGGSIVRKKNGEYHMYVSEIICPEKPGLFKGPPDKRCGLNNWETLSRIAQVKSDNVDGPYRRLESDPVVLHPEHHNPSVQVSPKTGDWHLFTISGPTGPIERMISKDEGKTWGNSMTVSPRQNPGPLLKEDGSTLLFYRADGLDIPYPTCSDEGISVQSCPSEVKPCNRPNDMLVFGHTGEDPSVFKDHRGNYHMLFNALPYKCVPKFFQGGHAWSTDGVNWHPHPRIGAFDTTIRFTDGTHMKCERRERPQMVIGKDGRPVAMVSAVTGCPRGLGDPGKGGESGSSGRFYKGGDDSFTMVQRMGS